ncbi:MAG: hypothetical protein EP329_05445 [Deltaproteobacteria bacterium]|nr:MAG: hypothetical protein EP329_05445 [Deltaproteobacteria bacterium]
MQQRGAGSLLLFVLLSLLVLGCGDPASAPARPTEGAVLVLVPAVPGADPSLDRIVDTSATYLEALVGVPAVVERVGALDEAGLAARAKAHGAGLVLVIDAHVVAEAVVGPDPLADAASEDAFLLAAAEVGSFDNHLDAAGGATVLYTAGRGLLGRQYAVYEALRRLGVRYYHPEDEHVPRLPADQVRARARTATALAPASGDVYSPDFAHRGFSFHGAHPLEHLEAFSDGDFPIDEAVHVNDWIVKNRGDTFRGAGRGVASAEARARRVAELDALRGLLGMRRTTGITLHNQQQGASAAIDPSLPTPVKDQIEAVVTQALEGAPDAYLFGIHFGPTELTTTPDEETVQWINWAGAKALELRPDLPVEINDHTSGSQPVDHYDDLGCPPGTNDRGVCDYYDLAFHADPRLGVKVHTVMFQPLEGPAGVYNQVSFAHKLCLMQRASAEGRRLTWFPEGSWWLSYDNPVPVYLPLYIYTRARDIALLKPLLASRGGGTLSDHRMFDSGHAWGYWQQDYAVGLWHWNADVTLAQVVEELTDPFCPPEAWPERCAAAVEVGAVLDELMAEQADDFLTREDWQGRPGGLYAYFSGEDPADELAAASGLGFRPVRVAFRSLLTMARSAVDRLAATDLARLGELAAAHDAWVQRLEAVRAAVPEAGQRWLDEIVDGVAIDGLRAAHTKALYDTVLALREAGGEETAEVSAALAAAAALRDQAEAVIRRREAAYRYPAAQMSAGGPTPELAVDNGTTYPYRVHGKTHLLWYWNNRQQQVADLVAGASAADPGAFTAAPVSAAPGTPVTLHWPDLAGLSGTVDLGDGASAAVGAPSHDYAEPGIYRLSGALESDGPPLAVHGVVARVDLRAVSAAGDFALVTPDSDVARGVLSALVSGFHFAVVPGADGAFAFGPDDAVLGVPAFADFHATAFASYGADGAFVTAPVDFVLPIADPSTGAVAASVRVTGATFSGAVDDAGLVSPLRFSGALRLADLVDALVALAGFDEEGAWATLSAVLELDPADPPETLDAAADLAVREDVE